ncbi:MAG: response regulator [Candidatus Omnitrophota bacterium]|nr:response regulator [Candidatus Omnitrophota bacterium]
MSKKILILDDEEEYLLSLQKFLQEFKYTVCVAASSSQALDAISKDKPDLVLFDYKLPDMDGDYFLKKAREISPSTCYILITAWNDPAIPERFKKMGAAEVILKPIKLEELLKSIRTILKE